METEKGTLSIGVEFGGKMHRDFELRPLTVGDSVTGYEYPGAKTNEVLYGVVIMTRRLVKLGDIPAASITPDLILSMHDADFKLLLTADEALGERLATFRGEKQA